VKVSPQFRVGLAGSIVVEAALVFYAWRTGILLFPSIGIVLIPFLLLIHAGIAWVLKRFLVSSGKVCFVQVGFWIFAVVGVVFCGWVDYGPKARFIPAWAKGPGHRQTQTLSAKGAIHSRGIVRDGVMHDASRWDDN